MSLWDRFNSGQVKRKVLENAENSLFLNGFVGFLRRKSQFIELTRNGDTFCRYIDKFSFVLLP